MNPFDCLLTDYTRDPADFAARLGAHLARTGRLFMDPTGRPVVVENGRLLELAGRRGGLQGASTAGLLEGMGFIRFTDSNMQFNKLLRQLVGSSIAIAVEHLPAIRQYVRWPAYKFGLLPNQGLSLIKVGSGYDPVSRTYCEGQAGMQDVLTGVPDPGFPHLRALFSGLLFADPVYHANLLGTLVACVARTAFERFPIILIDSARKASGKTTIAQTFGVVLTGQVPEPVTHAGSEDELEKRLTPFVGKPGPNFVFFDNVRTKPGAAISIRSQFFSAATGAHAAQARVLHLGPRPIYDPIIVLTMNGARVEQDLADRVVRLSLVLPDQVLHRHIDPYPVAYAKTYRYEILAECFHLLRFAKVVDSGWSKATRFYEFETVVRSVAQQLGMTASLDPADLHCTDGLLLDIAHCLLDDFGGGPVAPEDFVAKAEASPAFHDLQTYLRSLGRGKTGRAEALINTLQTCYPNNMKVVLPNGVRGRVSIFNTLGHLRFERSQT